MGDFVLTIFPEHTSAASVTTTVWIGVCVVVFFNLRLGWNLSGLVVPGYLAPLLIAKPISAGVICVEAIVTYWIVWLISERLNRLPNWCSFFGRDRFFALVVVSVLVRAVTDGWFCPWLGATLNESFGLRFDHGSHLHSYGLIIVALMANYFWKPGLFRGAIPLAVTVGATYLIVRFVLIEFTNFNVGSLHYMYEDIATSLLASPKAYIILITTAFIASWMNLRYGWEFNGILIPALLALQWYCPWKIVASFVEAAVIVVLAALVLKLPFWQRITMEGARKILLFFTISFLYRSLLGWLLPLVLPGTQVTDFFGFGYLLATLVAIKAHDHRLAIRVTRASLQVSIIGAVGGSVLGFLLTWLPNAWLMPAPAIAGEHAPYEEQIDEDIVELVRADKVLLYQKRVPDSFVTPFTQDNEQFAEAIRLILKYAEQRREELLEQARGRLADVNYAVHLVQGRYLYLREHSPSRGWGLYVVDCERPQGLSINVPVPLDEWASVEAGLGLFRQLNAGSLAIAGASPQTNRDGSADALNNPCTFFAAFHRLVGRGNTLQVRGYTRRALRVLKSVPTRDADGGEHLVQSGLWVHGAMPPDLKLTALRELIEEFKIKWEPTPWRNNLRDDSGNGFAELLLNRDDRRALVSKLAWHDSNSGNHGLQRLEGHLNHWLLATKEHIARRGTNSYLPAKQEELLYLDEEVLKPLLRIAPEIRDLNRLSSSRKNELAAVSSAATIFGYRLILLYDISRTEGFLVLAEALPPKRHWGTYVLRCGPPEPFVIEVPRPLYERNAFEFGIAQFERSRAAALLVAGAHPRTNVDGSSDVARLANKMSFFNLVHQASLREMGPRPMLVVQARAIQAPVDADVIVATGDGTMRHAQLSPQMQRLMELFRFDGLRTRFVDGQPQVAGYEVGMTTQALSISQAENKEFVGLWLSPSLRTKFQQQPEDTLQAKQFAALGIPTVEAELYQYLVGLHAIPQHGGVPRELTEIILGYLQTQDIVRLRQLQHHWEDYHLTRLIDRGSGQSFLLIAQSAHDLPLVVNLSGGLTETPKTVTADGLDRQRVRNFVESRATWLVVRAEP